MDKGETVKAKSILTLIALLISTFTVSSAGASQNPMVESFTFTPGEVDLLATDLTIRIELVVSHPFGINNSSTMVTLKGTGNNTLSTYLTRTDQPINPSLNRVTFRGAITIPRDLGIGVYNLSAASITNNPSAGYQYGTGIIEPKKIRNLIGAESGLLVRTGNELGLNFETFVGPSYDRTSGVYFNDPITFNSANPPIWKVGETFSPEKYFELRVPTLNLVLTSTTPTICTRDGNNLKLIKEGLCNFNVSTPKTNDYLSRTISQTVNITAARSKPELTVYSINDQTSKNLPKLIELPRVHSPSEGYIFPQSLTPIVCSGSGFYVRLISGGTCTLTYQSTETSNYVASDLYKISFEVTRDPQTLTFSLPSTANVSTRSITLAATASSGGAITYSTTSAGICSITGSILNLLRNGNCAVTATQAGTSTLAPASATATVVLSGAAVSNRKTITCVKGKSTKRVSGVNPKCPRGFKIKR